MMLSNLDLLLASGLVLINAAISLALTLGVARSILIAAARMVVQLWLLALVLGWLFATDSLFVLIGAMVIMGGFAGYEITARQTRPAGRLWTAAIGSGVILVTGWCITVPVTALILHATPWYSPAVLLPVFGMVAGNAMTGISLSLNNFSNTLRREAGAIEARLSVGQSWRQAVSAPLAEAVKTGLMPTINAMAAMGVVAIPGMMTGQLLAGADPLDAARYQMFIMFLIAGSSALAVLAASYAFSRRLTDARQRLRLDRIRGST